MSKKKDYKFKKRCVFLLSISLTLSIVFGMMTFLLYGPYPFFRNYIITSSMTTLRHQWIASWFYDEKTIDTIMKENTVIEIDATTDTNLIDMSGTSKWPGRNAKPTIKESEIIYADDDVIVEQYQFNTFKGWMMIVRDPKKIKLGISKDIGKKGECLQDMTKRLGAFGAINASGFADDGYVGDGGTCVGLVIDEGKVVNGYLKKNNQGIIGFTEEGILVVGEYSKEEIQKMNIKYAVEFRPFLIVNGETSLTRGNGGWGMAPRTAIGQRADGAVLMLAIEGRNSSSIGATIVEVQDLLVAYGAINAANLDGGSSTSMILQGKILNVPSSGEGERAIPNGFLVYK